MSPAATLSAEAVEWLISGEHGQSSRTMFDWLLLGRVGVWSPYDYPLDPDDLRRCLRLVRDVPELAPLIPRMAERGPYWAGLAARWDDLTATFVGEVGGIPDPYDRWTAPLTAALMASIEDPIRDAEKSR